MISYLLEVSLCWLLFYGIYVLLLSKETFFTINRWYLLATLTLGLLIPVFPLNLWTENPTSSVVYLAEGVSGIEAVIEAQVATANEIEFSWLTMLQFIYVVGVVITFCRFLYGIGQIYALYKNGEVYKKGTYNVVLTQTPHLPFSFFHYLFWSKSIELEDTDSGQILSHELAHINQWHSLDVLFLEFLSIFLWFSPPIYWYKKSLRAIHEYLADAYVLRHTHKKQYGHLLIKQVQSGMQIALANHFIHSQLKKRITMMTRDQSRQKALMRYLPALPLLLLLVLVFSNKNFKNNFKETTLKAGLMLEDFNPKKAKEQMRKAYKDGSKGVVVAETGEALNWDAQKIKALHRNCKEWIARFPKNETAIRLIMMEVAAENGYQIRFMGDNLSYKPIEGYQKGEEVTMQIDQGNLPIVEEVLVDSDQEVYKVVEEMPRFPGCENEAGDDKAKKACADKKMLEFIYKHIKYPAEARKAGIQGTVVTKMVINQNGEVENARIVRSIGGGTDEAVLSVVDKMPTWIPGKKDGKIVSVEFVLPVKFKLESDESDKTQKPVFDTKNGEKVYKVAAKMPLFPGCEGDTYSNEIRNCANKKMLEYVYTNIKYPKEAKEKGIEGTVVVRFIVNKDGSVSDAEIVRNVGGGTGEAALKVVNSMQEQNIKWIPGEQDGKKVGVVFNLPVRFMLDDNSKEKDAKKLSTTLQNGNTTQSLKFDLEGKTLSINAFPNPAKERVTVTLNGNAENIHLTVFDMNGKEFFSEKLNVLNGTYNKAIDLQNAAKGALIINVHHNGKDYQKKVIVQ